MKLVEWIRTRISSEGTSALVGNNTVSRCSRKEDKEGEDLTEESNM